MLGNERWKATASDVKRYVGILKSEGGNNTGSPRKTLEGDVVRPFAFSEPFRMHHLATKYT